MGVSVKQKILILFAAATIGVFACGRKSEHEVHPENVQPSVETAKTTIPSVESKNENTKSVQEAQEEQQKIALMQKAKDIEGLYRHWQDTDEVAKSTSRIALAQPVQSLQEVNRQVEAFEPVGCLIDAKKELLQAMSIRLEDYLDFMGNPNSLRTASQQLGHIPVADFTKFEQLLSDAKSGSVFCLIKG